MSYQVIIPKSVQKQLDGLPDNIFYLVPTLQRGNAARTLRRLASGPVSGTPERSNSVPTETIGTRQSFFIILSITL